MANLVGFDLFICGHYISDLLQPALKKASGVNQTIEGNLDRLPGDKVLTNVCKVPERRASIEI